jgi:hypothetical protein
MVGQQWTGDYDTEVNHQKTNQIVLTMNTIGGLPSKAIAVDSLRLLPPLNVPDNLSANEVKLSFSRAQLTT